MVSTVPRQVDLELDGKRYVGFYSVESDVVTVTYGSSTKSTARRDSSAERIARMLLRELVEEGFRGKS
jgi:hypothetical protein